MRFQDRKPDGHKYDRGHTAIFGSDQFTGATRLAAEACSRVGSGLVSVMSGSQAQVYRTTLQPDIMVSESGLADLNRLTTLLAGPGGCSEAQKLAIAQANSQISLVLDADAIRLWPDLPGETRSSHRMKASLRGISKTLKAPPWSVPSKRR